MKIINYKNKYLSELYALYLEGQAEENQRFGPSIKIVSKRTLKNQIAKCTNMDILLRDLCKIQDLSKTRSSLESRLVGSKRTSMYVSEDNVEDERGNSKFFRGSLTQIGQKIIEYCVVGDFIRCFTNELFIDDLYVKKEWRSKGIGTKILLFLKKRKKNIYIFVDIHNAQAMKFYERLGAKKVEESNDQNFTLKL